MSATSFREKIVKKYITKPNVKVLDIGCGPAEILSTLPNIQYYGFDINPIYINSAKKNMSIKQNFFASNLQAKIQSTFQSLIIFCYLEFYIT